MKLHIMIYIYIIIHTIMCVCVSACSISKMCERMHATANKYNKSLTNVALYCLPNHIDAVGAAEVNQEA